MAKATEVRNLVWSYHNWRMRGYNKQIDRVKPGKPDKSFALRQYCARVLPLPMHVYTHYRQTTHEPISIIIQMCRFATPTKKKSNLKIARWIAALFKLGTVCCPDLLMVKAKYCIIQRDLRSSFKTDSGITIYVCILKIYNAQFWNKF